MSTLAIHSIPWWHFSERRSALEEVTDALRKFNEALDESIAALPRLSAEDLEREICDAGRIDERHDGDWRHF